MTDIPGFTSGPPLASSPSPLETIPSTPFEGQDWAGLSRQLLRLNERSNAEQGLYDEQGNQIIAPEPRMAPADANAKYGIPGELAFDNPVPESVASQLYDAKREELVRQDAAMRAPSGIWEGAKRFGAGFVASAIDPLNIAASFVPVVGEARYGVWLADAGGAIGRAGVRAGVGAAQGIAGQAPLSLMRYGLSKQEQADYSATDALLDAVYGGLLGGGLHAIGGGIGDAVFDKFRGTDAARLADSDLAAREAALRTSIAQMADGRPVEVRPVFDGGLRRELNSTTALSRAPEIPAEFDPLAMADKSPAALAGAQGAADATQAASQGEIAATRAPLASGAAADDGAARVAGNLSDREAGPAIWQQRNAAEPAPPELAEALRAIAPAAPDDLTARPPADVPLVRPASEGASGAVPEAGRPQSAIAASPELQRLQAANGALQQELTRSLSGEPASLSQEVSAANAGVDRAERLARAYEQAGACLGMKG